MKTTRFSLTAAVFLTLGFMLTFSGTAAEKADVRPGRENLPAQDRQHYKAHHPVPFLIVTANYESPRKLAEIARTECNASYILLPAKGSKNPIMFIPPKRGNAIEIKRADLSRFIAFMRPTTVIILGNDSFVPEGYHKAVPEKINTALITDKNWKINALMLGNILNYPKMSKLYADHLAQKADQETLDRKIAEETAKSSTLSGN